jgi:RNA polymerase sigma-70 factor (ECF subfamily)
LIARAKRGDITAFELIVGEYEPKLVRFIYGLTRERELAEDLVQETFISAYRALPSTAEDLKLSAWLYKIALNKVRSEKRRKQPALSFPLPFFGREGGNEDKAPALDIPDPKEDSGETLGRREAIMKSLSKLPPDQATALLMDAQGYDDAEIAAVLDISVGAVRQKLFRGRKAFKLLFEKELL